ncbi:glycoside hydrolase family 15 protein, partial [Novosphingobium sp. TCA1]|uniref:glycoside hydrolase family 15 protein n=1 Tax=Novosphingobium sp. TCA1 TaxID=2682474 RepID=UPI001358D718
MKDAAITPASRHPRSPIRDDAGYLDLQEYGALGEGRSVAMTGADGAIDWWCVPNLDSPPLFDRLLDPEAGGFFSIAPVMAFTVERAYRAESNVLETVFSTATGKAVLVESLNSGTAGRLPWCELARRVEGLEGKVDFRIELRFGRRAGLVSPYVQKIGPRSVFHVGAVLGLFLHSDGIRIDRSDDCGVEAGFTVGAGAWELAAIVAGEDEPLVAPSIKQISERLDISDQEWRIWASRIAYDGPQRRLLMRNALALKLLLYSPSGAIAAAATSSLPERVGGTKNWDYRYAWVRDAGYTIKAFLAIGAEAEAKAAFTWLLKQLDEAGPAVCYSLSGGPAPEDRRIDVPGYRRSQPVVTGNRATDQLQHGIYGDIFETASRFVACGNILDARTARTLSDLADICADTWMQKDAGIWELPEVQHYTMSKVSCWQALARAVELADQGQLPTTCRDRWSRERDRIAWWIDEHCWSEDVGAYTFYPGTRRHLKVCAPDNDLADIMRTSA